MIDKRIGQRIKKKRLEAKYTLSELSDLCHLTKSFLSDVENGNRSISVESLINIVKHLRTTYDHILHGR